MKFVKFEIKNFKGINELTLDLNKLPHGKIFPLVGLNESGKTTILEAINLFQKGIENGSEHKILHKANSGSFTGSVEIKATLQLDETDNDLIKGLLGEEKYELRENVEEITITKEYKFDNSLFKKSNTSWVFPFYIKKKQAKNFVRLFEKDRDLWGEITNYVEEKLIPKILYFSDFLFRFPEKIHLENIDTIPVSESDKDILKEYRLVIDDVLRSINSDYNLNDFLTKIKAVGDPAKQSSASKIKNDIAKELKKRIIEPWSEIFPGTKKDILVDVSVDSNGASMEIKVDDGGSPFHIHERSLGFRWFFSFILFTEFRKMRDGENGEYLFLFDEPASNLHQSSQIKLLTIFGNLVNNAKIIYSTHSHYLLNIEFLSNAFVVKDEGRKKESGYDYKQDIKAISYRTFVADTDNDETHIKPILDILEFIESPLVPSGKTIFFEGKWDYYTFKWISKKIFKDGECDFIFYPGAGVDKYEKIFPEYLANNKKFIAIFDDDEQGKEAKNKCCENISKELENHIFTLGEVKKSFENFKTENLFLSGTKTDEKLNIQKDTYPEDTIYNKTHFNKSLENFLISNKDFNIQKSTENNFKAIFDFIQKKFEDLEK